VLKQFKFIDLFAGIGGMRLAFERLHCRCVFSSEWDTYTQTTYAANFHEVPKGDITKISSSEIPTHDILLAGFPCQPFSISGVSKKNSLGRPHGFEDKTQGTLFFEAARIIRDKQPKAKLTSPFPTCVGTGAVARPSGAQLGSGLWADQLWARSGGRRWGHVRRSYA
jgi:site-specific DNA-cytosine methylase